MIKADGLTRLTDVRKFLELLTEPNGVYEVRIPKCSERPGGKYQSTNRGYFDNLDKAVESATYVDEKLKPPGVYVSLNPISPGLLARSANRLEFKPTNATNDGDIARLRWLWFDIDSTRPAGVSATDAEVQHALDLASDIRAELFELGWGVPLSGMSGNGSGLFYSIDLPNNGKADTPGTSEALIKSVLHGLAHRFDNEHAKVDTSTFNASRICKVLGTHARKGDDYPGDGNGNPARPHRKSWFEPPSEPLKVITVEQLEAVAAWSPKSEVHRAPLKSKPSVNGSQSSNGKTSPLERCMSYVAKMPPAESGSGGSCATLAPARACHKFGLSESEAMLVMHAFNDSQTTGGKWTDRELLHKLQDAGKWVASKGLTGSLLDDEKQLGQDVPVNSAEENQRKQLPTPVTLTTELAKMPKMRRPVVEGLLREGETANLIAATKIGKSWMAYGLAYSVASGRSWLNQFMVNQGRVLICDNELHGETLRCRLHKVAEVGGYPHDNIDILNLRGLNVDLNDIGAIVDRIEANKYSMVIGDAFYRFIPQGVSENDNAEVMRLFNRIDDYADRLKACWVNVHHASKGAQGEKAVTDVGSGAGAMNRAADTVIVVRPHQDPDVQVMDSRVRSFPPMKPLALRFEYPLWNIDPHADATKVAKAGPEGRRAQEDERAKRVILDELLNEGELSTKQVMKTLGAGKPRTERLLEELQGNSQVESRRGTVGRNEADLWRRTESDENAWQG